jgi:PAS domain S-box-containing protein
VSDQNASNKQNIILKEILNSSWDGLAIIDMKGKFKFINKAFIPLLAYNEKELLNLSFANIIEEEYQEDFENLLLENKTNIYKNKLDLACKRKDGQIIFVRLSIKLMSNKTMYILNVSDINESSIKEKLSNEYLLKIDINKDGFILGASDAFYKSTTYTKQQLIGNSYTDILASITIPFQKNSLEKHIKEEKVWKGKLVIKNLDDSSFNVDAILQSIINKYGDVIAFTLAMINTSSIDKDEQKKLQALLVDEGEKLEIMSDTMRTVAHQWRQPLNTISLSAQELIFELDFEDDINKENIKEKLNQISITTDNLSKIIENFQSITDLNESKKKRNIKEIIRESIKISELKEGVLSINNQETKAFRTYPKELALAISSILINAKEILENKTEPKLNISTYDDGANIVCELSNNGGHIPTENLQKIFAPYYSTKEEKNGVGLSLYVCKFIVELHLKGSIDVQNIENDFVIFTLKFPKGALE